MNKTFKLENVDGDANEVGTREFYTVVGDPYKYEKDCAMDAPYFGCWLMRQTKDLDVKYKLYFDPEENSIYLMRPATPEEIESTGLPR